MAGFGIDLSISGIAATLVSVLVVVGLVFAIFWFFKKSDSLTEEDRLNIERSKVAWIGATALAVLLLFVNSKEKAWRRMGGGAAVRATAGRGGSASASAI